MIIDLRFVKREIQIPVGRSSSGEKVTRPKVIRILQWKRDEETGWEDIPVADEEDTNAKNTD